MNAPYCPHAPKHIISSHEDLLAVPEGEGMASMYVCDREPCLEKARHWVQGVSGRPAILKPLPDRARR